MIHRQVKEIWCLTCNFILKYNTKRKIIISVVLRITGCCSLCYGCILMCENKVPRHTLKSSKGPGEASGERGWWKQEFVVCLRAFEHAQSHRQQTATLACVCMLYSMDDHTGSKLVLWRVFAYFCSWMIAQAASYCSGVWLRGCKHAQTHRTSALVCLHGLWAWLITQAES